MDKNNIDYIENKCTKMEYQKYFLKKMQAFPVKAFEAIPLIPTNLPLNKKNITTAKPMIIPPRVAVIGVKFTIFI